MRPFSFLRNYHFHFPNCLEEWRLGVFSRLRILIRNTLCQRSPSTEQATSKYRVSGFCPIATWLLVTAVPVFPLSARLLLEPCVCTHVCISVSPSFAPLTLECIHVDSPLMENQIKSNVTAFVPFAYHLSEVNLSTCSVFRRTKSRREKSAFCPYTTEKINKISLALVTIYEWIRLCISAGVTMVRTKMIQHWVILAVSFGDMPACI